MLNKNFGANLVVGALIFSYRVCKAVIEIFEQKRKIIGNKFSGIETVGSEEKLCGGANMFRVRNDMDTPNVTLCKEP